MFNMADYRDQSVSRAWRFVEKFKKDIEIIHAKYSKSIDGDAEVLLSTCDLPDFGKVLKNRNFSRWQKSASASMPLPTLHCSPLKQHDSNDESNIVSFNEGDESGHDSGRDSGYINSSPVVDEDSTSSSSSDDMSGWDSSCSGPTKADRSSKILRRSKVNDRSLKSSSSTSDSLSDNASNKSLTKKSEFCDQVGVVVRSPNRATITPNSDLLAAMLDFRNLFLKSGVVDLGRSRKRSRNLPNTDSAISRKCLGDQESRATIKKIRKNVSLRKSIETVEPGCVMEKLFVRSKGAPASDMVEVASLRRNTGQANDSVSTERAQSRLVLAGETSIVIPTEKAYGNDTSLCHNPLHDSLGLAFDPNNAITSPLHSTPLKTARVPFPARSEPRICLEELQPRVLDGVDLLLHGAKPARRFTRSHGSYENTEERKAYLAQLSASENTRGSNDKRQMTPPAKLDLSATPDRLSVPLQATPGHTSLCLSDISTDLCPAWSPEKSSVSPRGFGTIRKRPDSDNSVEPSPRRMPNGARNRRLTRRSLTLSDDRGLSSITKRIASLQGLVDASKKSATSSYGGSGNKRQESVSPRRLYILRRSKSPQLRPENVDAARECTENARYSPGNSSCVQVGPGRNETNRRCTENVKYNSGNTKCSQGVPETIKDSRGCAENVRCSPGNSSYTQLIPETNVKDDWCKRARNGEPTTPTEKNSEKRYPYHSHEFPSAVPFKDDNPSVKCLKARTTPRRYSSGYHPYMPNQKRPPSISSPFQTSSRLSPTIPARWKSLDKTAGLNRLLKSSPVKSHPSPPRKPLGKCSKPRLNDSSDVITATQNAAKDTQDSCQGYCTKKFCFNCSMDCS